MTDPRAALAQADLLLLLSSLLSPPRGEAPGTWRIEPERRRRLIAWSGLADADALDHHLEQALAAAAAMPIDEWTEAYTGLFDGPTPCPINETAYVRRDKGWILADICGFYQAFGFRAAPQLGEKADHLVCEIEFCAMLLAMVARAAQLGDEEQASIAHEAFLRFAGDHLGDWVSLFAERLTAVAALPLYQRVARVLELTWNALAEAHDVDKTDRESSAAAPPDDDPGTPYECGMAEASPPIVQLRVHAQP